MKNLSVSEFWETNYKMNDFNAYRWDVCIKYITKVHSLWFMILLIQRNNAICVPKKTQCNLRTLKDTKYWQLAQKCHSQLSVQCQVGSYVHVNPQSLGCVSLHHFGTCVYKLIKFMCEFWYLHFISGQLFLFTIFLKWTHTFLENTVT